MIQTIGLVLLGWQLLVLGYYVVVNAGYLFITLFAFRDVSHGMSATADEEQLRQRLGDANLRPVSVIVPAHNEITTIVPTVEGPAPTGGTKRWEGNGTNSRRPGPGDWSLRGGVPLTPGEAPPGPPWAGNFRHQSKKVLG